MAFCFSRREVGGAGGKRREEKQSALLGRRALVIDTVNTTSGARSFVRINGTQDTVPN